MRQVPAMPYQLMSMAGKAVECFLSKDLSSERLLAVSQGSDGITINYTKIRI